MNYKEWSNIQFWGVIVVVFFLGLLLAPVESKECAKCAECVECDYAAWRALKEVDDLLLDSTSRSLGLCSDGITAIINEDIAEVEAVTAKVTSEMGKMDLLKEQRVSALGKLGY